MCRFGRLFVAGLVFATSLTGCSDPTSSRLGVGDRVMLVPGEEDRKQEGHLKDTVMVGFEFVPGGTEARVVRDDGGGEIAARWVVVHVLVGPKGGLTGKATRGNLRPIR